MKPTLRIALETAPIDRAEAEIAVASLFEGERPLRGAASRADWRLCGMLSDLVAAGRLSGAAGEALLVPTFRRLRAPRLLVVGLGPSAGFGIPQVGTAVTDAVSRLLDLRAGSAALGIPGDWLGAVPLRPAAEAVARGAMEALAARAGSLRLRLLVHADAAGRALRGLEAAAAARDAGGILVEPSPSESGTAGSAGATPVAAPSRAPISPVEDRP